MRNLPVLFVALGGLTAFAIPAAAESIQASCAAAPADSAATIDLQAIPMMSAAGPKSVKRVDDDGCDVGKSSSGARADRDNEGFDDSDD
ncbi:conserved exported hypothetical protein [Mesorhizobium plurifarium]|uniref:PepSY domain-containing protein n=1 Tax=Mesorhizobium plurifarium TaxID=69974 RepID=A0A090GUF6_MESPL|nr:conserved exported hypothetical protein [Mesorhizobium plurifarium]